MARIDSAYAYYLSQYGNNKPSRYDSHKKSDLRKVYNTIVKSNKEAPLYKLADENNATRYAIDIKENAKEIQNVVASLSDSYGNYSDSFRKKVAVSSDEETVEVNYIGDGSESSSVGDFSIEVQRLSSPQVNVGNFMKKDALSMIPGSYSFDLNTNQSSYEFQFNINPGETNLDVMKKLADLVNRSSLGIHASIRNGSKESGGVDTSALVLTSTQTGLSEKESYLFQLTPSAKAESIQLMNQLGIHQMTEKPKNSLFTLNGNEYSSLSNSFSINNTFELNLKKPTSENSPVRIGFKTDIDAIADNVMTLVDSFNKILNIAKNATSEATGDSNKLYNELSSLSKVRRDSLETIGLMVDKQGFISLNKETLDEAISPSRGEETFSTLSRFKDALGAKANYVAINPMQYVNKVVVNYKNPGKTFTAPYFTSIYSGMMLDRFA